MTEVLRRVGKPLPRDVKVADVFPGPVGGYNDAGVQLLPVPYTPAVVSPEKVGINDPGEELAFLFVADNGGIEDPNPQKAVIAAMAQRLPGPAFLYGGGDHVYFDGDPAQYMPQLYQPLERFPLPFVSVPGNHDGDPTDGVSGSGISSFMANMCTGVPSLPPCDPHDEFGRDTQTQPSHDWGLALQAVTILGVWTNVPSGGHLYDSQIAWLTTAVKAAPTDRPLIVVGHHPSYSVSADGGSSPKLNSILDGIWQSAGRWPELILAGHVHDAQFFTRQRPGGTTKYGVVGCSGYHHLHPIAGDYQPGMDLGNGIVCDYADGTHYGFLEIKVSAGTISGELVQVGADGTVTPNAYTFTA